MRGLNRITLIGNLGKPPELQTLEGGNRVAKFSLATTETYKDKLGKVQNETEWHSVVLWSGLADLAANYLHKGSTIYLEGKVKTRSYEDKAGEKRYVTGVIAESFVMLDKPQ